MSCLPVINRRVKLLEKEYSKAFSQLLLFFFLIFTEESSKNDSEAPVYKSFCSVNKQKDFGAMRKIQKWENKKQVCGLIAKSEEKPEELTFLT